MQAARGRINIYIIILLILCLEVILSFRTRHNRAARTHCKESTTTVEEVKSCPRDKETWGERARLKGCWNVPHNCSDTPLSYHCVLDELGHGLVEVCAMWTEIIGRRCAEFTPGGMFVQEHFENSCKSCPFAYNSSMSYLYDECFDFAKFTTDGPTNQLTTEKLFIGSTQFPEKNYSQFTESTDVRMNLAVLSPLLGVIVPIVGILQLILYFRYIKSTKNATMKNMVSNQSETNSNRADVSLNKAVDGESSVNIDEGSSATPLLSWKEIENHNESSARLKGCLVTHTSYVEKEKKLL